MYVGMQVAWLCERSHRCCCHRSLHIVAAAIAAVIVAVDVVIVVVDVIDVAVAAIALMWSDLVSRKESPQIAASANIVWWPHGSSASPNPSPHPGEGLEVPWKLELSKSSGLSRLFLFRRFSLTYGVSSLAWFRLFSIRFELSLV
jgi:hypothetical protein